MILALLFSGRSDKPSPRVTLILSTPLDVCVYFKSGFGGVSHEDCTTEKVHHWAKSIEGYARPAKQQVHRKDECRGASGSGLFLEGGV